jgi:hypothetical protein
MMTIKDNKIIKATEPELWSHWYNRGWWELYDFDDYKRRCIANGTEIIPETKEEFIDRMKREDCTKEELNLIENALNDGISVEEIDKFLPYYDKVSELKTYINYILNLSTDDRNDFINNLKNYSGDEIREKIGFVENSLDER